MNKPTPVDILNSVRVGDIFVRNWGYEANISDFIKVVKLTPKGCKTVRLERKYIGTRSWVEETVTAGDPIDAIEDAVLAKIKTWDNTNAYLSIGGNGYSRWNGQPIANYNHH